MLIHGLMIQGDRISLSLSEGKRELTLSLLLSEEFELREMDKELSLPDGEDTSSPLTIAMSLLSLIESYVEEHEGEEEKIEEQLNDILCDMSVEDIDDTYELLSDLDESDEPLDSEEEMDEEEEDNWQGDWEHNGPNYSSVEPHEPYN